MSLQIDSREFNAAFREYMKHTQRDTAEVLNQKSYSILLASIKLTFKPQAETIRQALGAIGQRIRIITRGKNKGKVKAGRVIVGKDSLAERIVRAKFHEAGRPQPTQEEGQALAEKYISKTVSAIGFLAFGFLAALHGFAGSIGVKSKPSSRNAFVRTAAAKRGGASPAKPGWRPEAAFWNTSDAEGNTNPAVETHASAGLQAAITQGIGRMADHVAKKLQATADKYSAR